MSKVFSTSADYLSVPVAVVTAPPFTIHAWVKDAALGLLENFVALATSGVSTNRFLLQKKADDVAAAVERDTASSLANTIAFPNTAWHGITGVFTSDSSRDVYLDGGNKGSNAAAKVAFTPNSLYVGRDPGGTSPFTGKIAYVAIWNRALTSLEVSALATQKPLSAAPSGLVAYYVLLADALDTAGSNDFTVNGSAGYDVDMPALDAILPGCAAIGVAGLIPTLFKERIVSPGVGAVTAPGNAPGISGTPSLPQPGVGLILVAGLTPTVNIGAGPTAVPDPGAIIAQGLAPTLWTSRTVVPDINTSEADEVGLAPTVIQGWLVQPGVGAIIIAGLGPLVIAAGSLTVNPGAGAISVAGLGPTLSVPAGQEGLALPFLGQAEALGLAPDLEKILTVTPDVGLISMDALLASVNTDFNWHDAPAATARSWH